MQLAENDVPRTQANNSPPPPSEDDDEECLDMEASVRAMEKLLEGYSFKDKKLLEEALTHKSCNDQSANYDRLEYLGDAALGLAISKQMFFDYPEADQHQLTQLRSVNASNEKLARVAVRHNLYRYLRGDNKKALDKEVKDFTRMVQQEDEPELYGGTMEAPRVLADIVESVAGALYVDCGSDLDTLWRSFKGLLEPLVSLEVFQKHPNPRDLLKRSCQKRGDRLKIIWQREGEETIASVYIDDKFIASGRPCKTKDSAELQAARAALATLPYNGSDDQTSVNLEPDSNGDIPDAKKKLKELCEKRKWPQPIYSTPERIGPAHDGRFVCSVEIATVVERTTGDEKSRIRDGENSAASKLLCKMFQMHQGKE